MRLSLQVPVLLTSVLLVSILPSPVVQSAQNPATLTPEERATFEAQNRALDEIVRAAPRLPLVASPLTVTPPKHPDWALGMVSWVAAGADGLAYLLQRGAQADPVLVVDEGGRIVRSWGRGLYTMPHAIRIAPDGHVWTTDAASSKVYKFSPTGTLLMTIEVGGQPSPCGGFCSTTDIAFASDGHLLIADGYRNARILEYTADGRKVREWGRAGTGPGEFRLPHSIQVDEAGVIYVADRENGRIQRFTRDGTYIGEWRNFGKTFGLTRIGSTMWLSTIPRGPNTAPGWLMAVDIASGRVTGLVDSSGNHGMAVAPDGSLLLGPGPDQVPQRYTPRR
jgi:hypothetical protein